MSEAQDMQSGSRVLAMGVFDLFHVGHLRYLQKARALGGHLTVGVTTDAICFTSKGTRPIVSENERLEIIRGLACVDAARLLPSTTIETEKTLLWMREWGIDHVLVGAGWAESARWTKLAPRLNSHGIRVSFNSETKGISSTEIIKAIRVSLGDDNAAKSC